MVLLNDGKLVKGMMFSPPYGDGTNKKNEFLQMVKFSPPYGDGTSMRELVARTGLFSPPYGENPLSHGLRRASSPERGSLVQGNGSCKSSPFRGSWRAAPERVLRGEVEVWYKDFDGMAKKFLSPYGDGTVYGGFVGRAVSFSPPYGDGTMRSSSLMVRSPFSPPYGDGTDRE